MKPIEVQISARVQAPKNGRRIPADLIRQAIIERAESGRIVPGIDLEIVSWKRGGIEHRAENSPDEWDRFRVFLQKAQISVITR